MAFCNNSEAKQGRQSNKKEGWGNNIRGQVPKIGGSFVTLAKSLAGAMGVVKISVRTMIGKWALYLLR